MYMKDKYKHIMYIYTDEYRYKVTLHNTTTSDSTLNSDAISIPIQRSLSLT